MNNDLSANEKMDPIIKNAITCIKIIEAKDSFKKKMELGISNQAYPEAYQSAINNVLVNAAAVIAMNKMLDRPFTLRPRWFKRRLPMRMFFEAAITDATEALRPPSAKDMKPNTENALLK